MRNPPPIHRLNHYNGTGRRNAWHTDGKCMMSVRDSSTSKHVETGVLVCLCFLLSSEGYLAWLYHLLETPFAGSIELATMGGGYLAQAVGIALFMAVSRTRGSRPAKRLVLAALVIHLAVFPVAIMSSAVLPVIVSGYVANLLYGVMQGFYLEKLCTQVEKRRRGTVFGCGYGLSTVLTWLLSLPGGGMLARGIPGFAVCALLSAAVVVPVLRADDGSEASSVSIPAPLETVRPLLRLCIAAIFLASLVKTVGFSYPTEDILSGVNLELSRILYGLGIAVAGILADRDRRLGLALCAASLVMPFLLIALSGVGASAFGLWMLAYLLTGIYVLFSVLLTVDLAEEAGREYMAGSGMLVRHVGDTLGTVIYVALAARPIVLIVIAAVLFALTAMVFLALFRREITTAEPTSPEERERRRFDRFAATHDLSARERQILRLVLDEKSNAEIADELVLSLSTVKFHMTNLLKKTGCKTRLEILAKYAENE